MLPTVVLQTMPQRPCAQTMSLLTLGMPSGQGGSNCGSESWKAEKERKEEEKEKKERKKRKIIKEK